MSAGEGRGPVSSPSPSSAAGHGAAASPLGGAAHQGHIESSGDRATGPTAGQERDGAEAVAEPLGVATEVDGRPRHDGDITHKVEQGPQRGDGIATEEDNARLRAQVTSLYAEVAELDGRLVEMQRDLDKAAVTLRKSRAREAALEERARRLSEAAQGDEGEFVQAIRAKEDHIASLQRQLCEVGERARAAEERFATERRHGEALQRSVTEYEASLAVRGGSG